MQKLSLERGIGFTRHSDLAQLSKKEWKWLFSLPFVCSMTNLQPRVAITLDQQAGERVRQGELGRRIQEKKLFPEGLMGHAEC